MMKLTNYGHISQAAIDLLVKNGAVIEYDGDTGSFHKLPPNCQMSDLYGGELGPADLGIPSSPLNMFTTRIYRDISFNGNVVAMGVSSNSKSQECDRLRIKEMTPNLS